MLVTGEKMEIKSCTETLSLGTFFLIVKEMSKLETLVYPELWEINLYLPILMLALHITCRQNKYQNRSTMKKVTFGQQVALFTN